MNLCEQVAHYTVFFTHGLADVICQLVNEKRVMYSGGKCSNLSPIYALMMTLEPNDG